MRRLVAALTLLLIGATPGASADDVLIRVVAGHAGYGAGTDGPAIVIAATVKPLHGVVILDGNPALVLRCLSYDAASSIFFGSAQDITSAQYTYFLIDDYGIPLVRDAIAISTNPTAGRRCGAPANGELRPATSTIATAAVAQP
ncbi:MAG: hypothetical protein ACRDJM_06830 [Actinomycetota bacterium]